MNEPIDLAEGWPADEGNEELLAFAQQVQGILPNLPPDSLARVEHTLQTELRRQQRRRLLPRLALAAAVLLALGAGGYFWTRPRPAVVEEARRHEPAPPPVEDRIKVAVQRGDLAPAVEKPLLRVEEYQGLFTN